MSSANDQRHDEFMQLFLEHQPRIYGYVRSLMFQKADADDVIIRPNVAQLITEGLAASPARK